MSFPVTFEDVVAARERIAASIVRTPALAARALTDALDATLVLKLETRQRTGSFKDRGAANRLLALGERERKAGVIAMSAGNHAQAVAYQARRLGVPATIVMPSTTPFTKVRRTKQFGARVILEGETLIDCTERTLTLAADEGLTIVHPYDDARIIAGQGTAALELLEDAPDLDVLVVPIGGGGLIAGTALVARRLRPQLQLIGVQTELFPTYFRVRNGLPPWHGPQTIAEGIAVKSIGALPLEILNDAIDDVVLVSEASIERAIHLLLEDEKVLAEGAGATPLAAVLDDPGRFAGKRVGLMICGANIDTGLLATVLGRVRLREGRVVRMRVEINDTPGVLADVARLIGECGANILDVEHQRHFHDVPSKNAELDITVETSTPEDLDTILAKLQAARYTTSLLESTAKPSGAG